MKRLSLVGLIVVALMAGCTSTTFQAYQGRGDVIEGKGGTKTIVDGVEFWENGEPPRKFKLIGIIDDERGAGWAQRGWREDVAKEVKKNAGDAVVLLSSDSRITGYTGSSAGTAFPNGTTVGATNGQAVRRNYQKFAVIKYVD